jgi:putative Mn2+ efflux pump MntP
MYLPVLITLFLAAASTSIDSMVIAVTIGLISTRKGWGAGPIVAACMATGQTIMTVLGFAVGVVIGGVLGFIGRIIAFGVLVIIAVRILYDARENEDGEEAKTKSKFEKGISIPALLALGFTISLDEAAVGLGLGLVGGMIWTVAIIFFLVLFVFTTLGYTVGKKFGEKSERRTRIAAGILLLVVAVLILLNV